MHEIRSPRSAPLIAGQACLVLVYTGDPSSGLPGLRIEIPTTHLIIGRGADADLQIDLDAVSRRHARIHLDGGRWFATDLNSSNGTYVNDEAIGEQPHAIADGDHLRIGVTIFRFLCGPDLVRSYFDEIVRLSLRDGLTGAASRRHLREALEREVGRAERHRRPLSLVRFDVERLRRLCDSHGALTGDYLLVEVARRARAQLRPDDLLGRCGWDQFALLLPETGHDEALALAARIAEAVAGQPFEFGEERLHATLVTGVAAHEDGSDAAALLRRAEAQIVAARGAA